MINVPSINQIINDDDVRYLFRTCAESKFVRGNSHYSNVVDNTEFVFDANDETINAYAGQRHNGYQITLLMGITCWVANFAFLRTLHTMGMPTAKVSMLAAWFRSQLMADDDNPPTVQGLVIAMKKVDFAKFHIDGTYFRELWRSNVMVAIEACIAHEMGHICLGHCDDPGYDGTVMSSNRNIERQADLFSCSILQCGTNTAEKGMGALLLMLSLYCFNPQYVGDRTHPDSSERIDNMLTSFKNIIPEKDVAMIRSMMKAIYSAKLPKPKKPKKKDED